MENPLEATNLAFNGTLAVNGEAYGIVVRTGDRTVIGQIASLTAGEEKRASPMAEEIDHFVKLIAGVALITALVFFLISILAKGMNPSIAVNFAIGTFISFVPEGLPATVTMLLTIAAKRMAKRNVLVKDLQGVETLGAITLLATDKTGTLTRNQMTVTYMWTGFKTYFCLNKVDEIDSDVELLNPEKSPGANEILMISSLCSKAKFDRTDIPISERTILGDATETGLVRFAAEKLSDFDQLGETYPAVFEIPFNSENKWHLSIHKKSHDNGKLTLYIKGAPERILKLCDKIFDGEKTISLTDQHKNQFQEKYKNLASTLSERIAHIR
jgi:sodium/potassium-transporting ATPase subunit alpha